MGNPSNTPKPNNNNSASDTPPSPESATSNTTASSGGTAFTATVSAVLFPAQQLPAGAAEGSEGEEEEEEEELDQEAQLPKEIKEKVYLVGDEGELELIKDLEKHGLADYKVDLDCNGKAHSRKMPTRMHQGMIATIQDIIMKSQEQDKDKLHAWDLASVKVGMKGVKKDPAMAVWGNERLKMIRRVKPKTMTVDGFKGPQDMNPHVIFEVSWTNKLETEEIPKFRRQMDNHVGELGEIKLGFLIKSIPANGKMALPTEESPGLIPLCGFDVYEARCGGGSGVKAGKPSIQYRVGGTEDVFITITSDDLGHGDYSEIRIPLVALREELEDCGVSFEAEHKED